VDPVSIIVKAVNQGVNYLDTSNVYGPSQTNYGKAFQALDLVPGQAGYDEAKRRSLHLASKTFIRYAKGGDPQLRGFSDGGPNSLAIDDLKRSLSQMFGDGQGNYAEGAYIDIYQLHCLMRMEEVDAIYEGLDNPDPKAETIGVLAALVDYRDGTNLTGLNPKEEKLIRNIGITGHQSSPVMMECLQRDEKNIIDTMLIAINANDRQYQNHQYNVMPVARARNVGMIAMKVFADGAMYTKEPRWSQTPEDVVRFVGTSELPSRPLIEYALSTPGIGTAIIGIGHIDSEERRCQLMQNMSAAQILPESLSQTDRDEIEALAFAAREGQTNWYQEKKVPLGVPREVKQSIENSDGNRVVKLSWQTAYAADDPIEHYEILRNDQPVGQVPHKPQTTKEPFVFEDTVQEGESLDYRVVTVDRAGNKAASGPPEEVPV
jgi:aryl-alcohol dehydrogenase-like predicted oxidoreductase